MSNRPQPLLSGHTYRARAEARCTLSRIQQLAALSTRKAFFDFLEPVADIKQIHRSPTKWAEFIATSPAWSRGRTGRAGFAGAVGFRDSHIVR